MFHSLLCDSAVRVTDLWGISTLVKLLYHNKVSIFNRWGDIVFYSEDYLLDTPWDGRLNNSQKTLTEGTYYAWMEFTVDGVVYQQSQVLYLIK